METNIQDREPEPPQTLLSRLEEEGRTDDIERRGWLNIIADLIVHFGLAVSILVVAGVLIMALVVGEPGVCVGLLVITAFVFLWGRVFSW